MTASALYSDYSRSGPNVRSADSILAWILALALVRSVVPAAIQYAVGGRPPPLAPADPVQAAGAVSAACSLGLVLLSLAALARSSGPGQSTTIFVPWIAWLGWSAISGHLGLGGVSLSTAAVSGLVLVAVSRSLPGSPESVERVLFAAMFLVMLYSLALAALDPTSARYGLAGADWLTRNGRLAGPLSTPNELANLAAVSLVLAAGVRSVRAPWRLAAGLASLVVLALTQSYTSWLAALVGLAVVVVRPVSSGHRHIGVRQVAIAVAFGLAVWQIVIRIRDTELAGLSGRTVAWEYVQQNWEDRAWLGHGANTWRLLIEAGAVPRWAVNAHNQYYDALFTAGIIGVVLISLAVLVAFLRSVSLWRKGFALPLGILSVELVRSYTEVPFQLVFGGINLFVLIATLAILGATQNMVERENTDA